MSNVKKVMMAAAAGGEGLNAEDLFNSSKWRGLGSGGRHIPTGINMGTANAGPSFNFKDGYVRRNSLLTGQQDSKTFTTSFWFYGVYQSSNYHIFQDTAGGTWRVSIDGGNIKMIGYQSGFGTGLNAISSSSVYTYGKWSHILISFDLSDTSKRYVYIDDTPVTMNWNTYSNANLITGQYDFVVTDYSGAITDHRIAHLFYDYTYRDLSITSNRRLFYTSSGGVAANQASLNPIVYLKLDTEGSAGTNSGTGGDFNVVDDLRYDPDFGPYTGDEGQGGMVWMTKTNTTERNYIVDSERGAGVTMRTNEQDQERNTDHHYSFDHKGWTAGQSMNITDDYIGWSFRKAPKFFDIVTWTGNGSADWDTRQISHNLGSVPGFIMIGRRDSADDWWCAARKSSTQYAISTNGATSPFGINTTNSAGAGSISDCATASVFMPGFIAQTSDANINNATYVAYLFAHNDGDGNFGPTGDQDIIKCGSYTSGGSDGSPFVDLGFEPEWLMIKSITNSDNWVIMENKRNWVANRGYNESDTPVIYGNTTGVAQNYRQAYIDVDGFYAGQGPDTNETGQSYIYMAIRHTSQGFPTRADKVWDMKLQNPNSSLSGFQVEHNTIRDPDMTIAGERDRSPASNMPIYNKLNGYQWFNYTNYNWSMLGGSGTYFQDDRRDSESFQDKFFYPNLSANSSIVYWHWKRASGFFDVVNYDGSSSAQDVKHNLNAVPEMIWVKRRTAYTDWAVYHKDLGTSKYMSLNQNYAQQSYSLFTGTSDTTFSVIGNDNYVNSSGDKYVGYLFGSVDGISKVGSFTYNGSTAVNVDCGFTNGARWVMAKRYDGTGNWIVWDTQRGINAGNDIDIRLDTTSGETSGYDPIDPYSAGFTINPVFGSSQTYWIFYAIA